MRSAWVVFLDVYGFSALAETNRSQFDDQLSTNDLASSLAQAHRSVLRLRPNRVAINKRTRDVFIFSDSMFLVFFPTSNDYSPVEVALQKCLHDVGDVQKTFLALGVPLRGGIAFGEIAYSNNGLFGSPVNRAVSYEKIIEFPLVILPQRELKAPDFDLSRKIKGLQIVYDRDNFPFYGKVIFPHPREEILSLVQKYCKSYLTHGPAKVASAWLKAYQFIQKHDSEYRNG